MVDKRLKRDRETDTKTHRERERQRDRERERGRERGRERKRGREVHEEFLLADHGSSSTRLSLSLQLHRQEIAPSLFHSAANVIRVKLKALEEENDGGVREEREEDVTRLNAHST